MNYGPLITENDGYALNFVEEQLTIRLYSMVPDAEEQSAEGHFRNAGLAIERMWHTWYNCKLSNPVIMLSLITAQKYALKTAV